MGRWAELLDDNHRSQVHVASVLFSAKTGVQHNSPGRQDNQLVLQLVELEVGGILAEISDTLFGKHGVEKMEAIAQVHVWDVLVHVHSEWLLE